jgi:hypothetical protein
MRLRNAAAASGPEDVAVRNIPILTAATAGVNLTRARSGYFLLVKSEDSTLNDYTTVIST